MNTDIQLRQCKRAGLDITKRCNWKCTTCFYRYADDFNSDYHKSMSELRCEIDEAYRRGCDHVVAVGWGETGLYKDIIPFIEYIRDKGMTSSIITNGSLKIDLYDAMYDVGLNHLHVSVHGIGDTLNKIADSPVAAKHQDALLDWLAANKKPFRTNTTLQQLNYRELPKIMKHCAEHGSFHSVLLGFLPHYQWNDPAKMGKVAVHPGILRPYIESALQELEYQNVYATLRYQPLCHLSRRYWKYVTNALYVLYDPWEWDYGHCGKDERAFAMQAINMANITAIQGEPCSLCDARVHCGGWNRIYAAGFNGANLKPIKCNGDSEAGYHFLQNPVNRLKGWI